MNDDRGQLVTVWSEGPILPPSLTEHVEKLNYIDDEESELSVPDMYSYDRDGVTVLAHR